MTLEEAIQRLQASPGAADVADALEVSPRQLRRYTSGEADTPEDWPETVEGVVQDRIRELKALIVELRARA